MGRVEATGRRSLHAAWSRIRLESGERVLVSMSANGIVVLKMVGGFLPVWRLWGATTIQLVGRFGYDVGPDDDYIDKVADLVLQCESAAEAKSFLCQRFLD